MDNVVAFLSYGQGGQPVDIALSGGGIDRLASRIRSLGITCHVHNWDEAILITSKIKSLPADTKIIVGGTSLGANEAPRIGALLKTRTIDFMFGIQPSKYGVYNLVTSNVKRAMYFYQPWWFIFGLSQGFGSYQWQKASGNKLTVMLSAYSFASHPGSNHEATQNYILAEIRKLV